MNFSVSLFLLCFMLQNTFSVMHVWKIVPHNGDHLQMDYDRGTIVNSKQAYVFTHVEPHYRSIIYVVGTQLTPYRKLMAAQHAVLSVKQILREVSGSANIHFTRKTSTSLRTFGDVEKWESAVFDKIPRLYRIGTDGIIQIPLKPEFVNKLNAFLLHDGPTVVVYYSYDTNIETKKIANAFAGYIVNFQRKKYNVSTDISVLGGKKNYDEFVKRINNRMEIHLHNIIISILKNDVANFVTINEELNVEINNAGYEEDEEDDKLKTLLDNMLKDIIAEQSATASDEKISSSFTDSISLSSTSSASSSTGSVRQKFKRKTTRKGKKMSSRQRQSAHVATFPKNGKTFILGATECQAVKTYPIDAIKPTCVYVILDFDNGESFVYFGRYGENLITNGQSLLQKYSSTTTGLGMYRTLLMMVN